MIRTIGVIIAIAVWIWIMYEVYTAPEIDDNGNIKNKKQNDPDRSSNILR